MEKAPLLPGNPVTPRSSAARLRRLAIAAAALLCWTVHGWGTPSKGQRAGIHEAAWRKCGSGLECRNVAVPLDWNNELDGRTVELAVLRSPALDQSNKLGSIFFNPGGPGGSGTGYIGQKAQFFHTLLKGRFDLISWDPRGINLTSDHVSCHESALDQYLFQITSPQSLDLPGSNLSSPAVRADLSAQIRSFEASATALFQQCLERTGHDALSHVGTQSVVRDLDFLAETITPGERINYWGMSYGSVVGQYMTSLLSPKRLNSVLLDGIVNITMWNTATDRTHPYSGLSSIPAVLRSFARSCVEANHACALAHIGTEDDILAAIISLVDSLYEQPLPALNAPGYMARARHARQALFSAQYSIKLWPMMSERLEQALRGNMTGLVELVRPKLSYNTWAEAARHGDTSGAMATMAIRCADVPAQTTRPTISDIATDVLTSLERNSPLLGDQFYPLGFCHLWPVKSRSFYNGTFRLGEEVQFRKPVLITTQREDPVTPLSAAELAFDLLGGRRNARLIEQGGSGHCVISQASLCTAKKIRAYFLEDKAPADSRTFCEVDEVPFQNSTFRTESLSQDDRVLLEAWTRLGELEDGSTRALFGLP